MLRRLLPQCRCLVSARSYSKQIPQSSTELENINTTRSDDWNVTNTEEKQNNEQQKPVKNIKLSTQIVKDATAKFKVVTIKEEPHTLTKIPDKTYTSITETLLRSQDGNITSLQPGEDAPKQITTHKKRPEVPEALLKPSFNFAPFVNHSKTLQRLLQLGVDLSYWEGLRNIPEIILRKDFDRDFKPYIQFLVDKGVPTEELGKYFTKNPYILSESLENLQVRINYFEMKKFSPEAIAFMIHRAPLLLNQKTSEIDLRLGFFQKELFLNGDEVRSAITRQPKLLTWNFVKIRQFQYTLSKEFGFSQKERRKLFLTRPKLWRTSRSHVQERFDYVHNVMGIAQEDIARFPEVLSSRLFRIKERHRYLESIKRAQFDPTKENYVSLKELVAHTDENFCVNIAKTTVGQFNDFLKTL